MNLIEYDITNLRNVSYLDKKENMPLYGGIEWEFDLIIDNILRIVSDNPKQTIFIDINEDVPNHHEILETIQKIFKEGFKK